jgi:hypothetical protein
MSVRRGFPARRLSCRLRRYWSYRFHYYDNRRSLPGFGIDSVVAIVFSGQGCFPACSLAWVPRCRWFWRVLILWWAAKG